MFIHRDLRLLLMVYVDVFKLAGPSELLAEGWKLIRSDRTEDGLIIDEPAPMNLCLGCHHKLDSTHVNNHKVQTCEWIMSEFLEDSVQQYCVMAKAASA